MTKSEIASCLDKEVFSTIEFQNHVSEVALLTNVKRHLVEKILTDYFTNILIVINTVRKFKTKINIFAFLHLIIEKGKRI